MKKFLLASTLFCAMSGYALAADAIVEVPPEVYVAPVFSWTGGYIGGQVGYLWGEGDAFSDSLAATAEIGPDGWLGGVYVGYNYQMTNNVVIGIDADFAWTGAEDSSFVLPLGGGGPIASLDTELDWEGAVRARLGYAVDRFLPYIAGGVAFGHLEGAAFDPAFVGAAEDTSVGWTIGAGVEYAFTDNLIARAEYRYTDFGDFDFSVQGEDISVDLTTNDVRFGLAWKF